MASRKPYPLLDRPWRRLRNYQRPHLMWRRITASEARSLKTRWAWGEGKNPCAGVCAHVCINRIVCFLVSVCISERGAVSVQSNIVAHLTPPWLPLMYLYFLSVLCVCVCGIFLSYMTGLYNKCFKLGTKQKSFFERGLTLANPELLCHIHRVFT